MKSRAQLYHCSGSIRKGNSRTNKQVAPFRIASAAWIVERFHTWSDHRGDFYGRLGRDAMLTNIMLYWITGAIGSSFWPCYARMHGPWPIPDGARIGVPMGYAEFPKEILRPPRSLAEKMYSDIRRWSKMPKGGHFAALEQPELLAREIREFFRPLREGAGDWGIRRLSD